MVPSRFPKINPVVACVWVKPRYTLEQVLILKAMVKRNLYLGHEFVCLTDHTEAIDELRANNIRPIVVKSDLKGWWQKIRLFDPKNFSPGSSILYLDLDVVVAQSLDEFFCVEDPMVMIANFGVNFRHSKYNSSAMLWENGHAEAIYTAFNQLGPDRVMKHLHGDQCWIWRVMRDSVAVWPSDWVRSFKYDVRKGGTVPPVTVFHGDPKPTEVFLPFVKEHYRK
jgi:hypothetical protein